jgi:cytochrome oxidase Cu insertion factor (SCO1/SenC/PrrC family)
MTEKKKIVLIYTGVAVFSALILGMSFFLTTLKKKQQEQELPVTGVGKEEVEVLNLLRQDIVLERESGEKVRISSLHDKVWVAAQFYVSCPMCAQRNADSLVTVYNEFKDDDDFMVACFSVDPENDTKELLSEVREVLEVDQSDWWFLKAERKKLWDFMENQMGFVRIEERFDPIHIQQKGRWAHDIGLQVYRGTALVHKWDVAAPMDQLRAEVRKALADLKEQKAMTTNVAAP